MDIKQEFGKRVRELRLRRKLTQEQLSVRCGKGFVMQRIGEIERGEANCTLHTVAFLAKGLECEPAELFLFSARSIGRSFALPDARLQDLWAAATPETRKKLVRVLTDLLT